MADERAIVLKWMRPELSAKNGETKGDVFLGEWKTLCLPLFCGFCTFAEFKEEGFKMADDRGIVLKWMNDVMSAKNGPKGAPLGGDEKPNILKWMISLLSP